MSSQDQSANIVRVERRNNPYVVIDKTALLETELSWKAKGIHACVYPSCVNADNSITQVKQSPVTQEGYTQAEYIDNDTANEA